MFRDRARHQFQMAIREMPVSRNTVSSPSEAEPGDCRRHGGCPAGGRRRVTAAADSLPDSPLYQVKLATESVRLALTPSDLGKAELNAQFADKRVDEIIEMAAIGNTALVEETTDRMNSNLVSVVNLTASGQKFERDMSFSAIQVPGTSPNQTQTATAPAPAPEKTAPCTAMATCSAGEAVTEDGNRMTDDYLGHDGIPPVLEDDADGAVAFRDDLIRQYEKNIRALREQLDAAPDFLKPALQHALEVAECAYIIALENLSY